MCFGWGWGGTLLGFAGGYLVGRETDPRREYARSKFCQGCGASIDAVSRFCPYCGKEQAAYGISHSDREALEILKERYARGEISTEEFQKMKREIT